MTKRDEEGRKILHLSADGWWRECRLDGCARKKHSTLPEIAHRGGGLYHAYGVERRISKVRFGAFYTERVDAIETGRKRFYKEGTGTPFSRNELLRWKRAHSEAFKNHIKKSRK